MKSPLRYQMTEYDSAQTSILNGISYLMDREKINPSLISQIYRYSFDNMNGEFKSDSYQSDNIMTFITKYINDFNKMNEYKLHFDEMDSSNIDMNFIKDCVSNNQIIIMPVTIDNSERYVTITNTADENVCMFDPYYIDNNNELFTSNKDIIFEDAKPFEYNRIISKDRLFANNIPYAKVSNKKAFVLTSNKLKEGVKISRKFDYIFEKTTI